MAINPPEKTREEALPLNTVVLMWQGLIENLTIMLNAVKAGNIEERTNLNIKGWYIKGSDSDIEGNKSIPVYVNYLTEIMPDNLSDDMKTQARDLINQINSEMERYTGVITGIKNTWLYAGIVVIVIIIFYFKFGR